MHLPFTISRLIYLAANLLQSCYNSVTPILQSRYIAHCKPVFTYLQHFRNSVSVPLQRHQRQNLSSGGAYYDKRKS